MCETQSRGIPVACPATLDGRQNEPHGGHWVLDPLVEIRHQRLHGGREAGEDWVECDGHDEGLAAVVACDPGSEAAE